MTFFAVTTGTKNSTDLSIRYCNFTCCSIACRFPAKSKIFDDNWMQERESSRRTWKQLRSDESHHL